MIEALDFITLAVVGFLAGFGSTFGTEMARFILSNFRQRIKNGKRAQGENAS